jgi:hypothetical protein
MWSGVHNAIIVNLAQQLAVQVRPRYRVHTERYLMIGEEFRRFRPDLSVTKLPDLGQIHPSPLAVTQTTLTTETLPYPESDIPPYLEILTPEGEIITVIEVLSPVNKEGEYNSYLAKRYRLLKAGIHLMEIDLLREGQRVPLAVEVDSPYMCLVTRAHEYPKTHVWKVTWSEPLPVLPVPLQPDDPDVLIELAPAVAQAFEIHFEGFVDYTADPPGELSAAWREEIGAILKGNKGEP